MAMDYLQPAFGEARTRALRHSTGAYLAAMRGFAKHGRCCYACWLAWLCQARESSSCIVPRSVRAEQR